MRCGHRREFLQSLLEQSCRDGASDAFRFMDMLDKLHERACFSAECFSINAFTIIHADNQSLVFGGKCFVIGVGPSEQSVSTIRAHKGTALTDSSHSDTAQPTKLVCLTVLPLVPDMPLLFF